MFFPRRIIVGLAAVVVVLWLVFHATSYQFSPLFDQPQHHVGEGNSHGPTRAPGRPDYLPFHPRPPPDHEPTKHPTDTDNLWMLRAESVKQAFLHAYQSYERYAPFPNDELLPLTNQSINNLNGWGLTLVDSLDTMLLLGLQDEFQQAVSQIETLDFSMQADQHAPFFETVIRYLGGLLSAYALSKEPILRARAEDLGTRLLPAFNTTSGMPAYAVNTQTNETHRNNHGTPTMLFAEVASCQMEYKYLAYITGREVFFTTVEKVMDHLKATQSAEGMWATSFNIDTGKPVTPHYSVGAWADSAYEYLLKQYLLSGKTEHRLARLYMTAVQGILENLVFVSHTRNLLYITDIQGPYPSHKFEHLSCFFPGLLALGASALPSPIMSDKERELHMWAAEGLAHTCWIMYADQPSGLGPDIVRFDAIPRGGTLPSYYTPQNYSDHRWIPYLRKWEQEGRPGEKPPGVGNAGPPLVPDGDAGMDYTLYNGDYLLRPETLESMFIMYRVTKDPRWRDRGWQIWESIESKTRLDSGYTSVHGVDTVTPSPIDSMPSYFLAETIKYAYLIALDEDPWPADKFILNTEAHPLPVFNWSDWQRQRLGVDDGPILR